MKYLILFLAICTLSCEKAIEKAKEERIIEEITQGQWRVTNFVNAGIDVTADFSAYLFQFKTNKTVDAIKNGTIEKNGSWEGDVNNRTIKSLFSNASHPLVLLNGTWNITDSGDNYVVAYQVVNGQTRNLRLDR
jgi:hypothetical protein